MNRRTFLTSISILYPAASGCQSLTPGGPEATAASEKNRKPKAPITDYRFTLVDPAKRFTPGDSSERFKNAARIESHSEKQVIITGRLLSGSRSCMKTVLERLSYDEGTDRLDVVVADRRIERTGPCTTEVAVVPYRLKVSFESELPERISIKHTEDDDVKFAETIEV